MILKWSAVLLFVVFSLFGSNATHAQNAMLDWTGWEYIEDRRIAQLYTRRGEDIYVAFHCVPAAETKGLRFTILSGISAMPEVSKDYTALEVKMANEQVMVLPLLYSLADDGKEKRWDTPTDRLEWPISIKIAIERLQDMSGELEFIFTQIEPGKEEVFLRRLPVRTDGLKTAMRKLEAACFS